MNGDEKIPQDQFKLINTTR